MAAKGWHSTILRRPMKVAHTAPPASMSSPPPPPPPQLPVVSIAATDPGASEAGPKSGTFTISRSGATTQALAVSYSIGGAASNGVDYTALSGTVTIAAGSASALVTVAPVDDNLVAGHESRGVPAGAMRRPRSPGRDGTPA